MIKVIDLDFLGLDEAIASFLIETTEGLVLIESGPYSTFKNLEVKLANENYRIEDVKHVLLTHIHLDHAGAAWAFAEKGAKIYVHPFGYKHLNDPTKLINSAKRIYQEDMDRLWSDMKGIPDSSLVSVDDDFELKVGNTVFKALHTPGHAIHHIAWQFEDILFTGDVAGVKIEEGPVMPPCPPPDIHIEHWLDSIEKILNGNFKTLYLTHFGKIENIEAHLESLKEELLVWANWIKPRFENQENPHDVTPIFQDFVAKRLRNAGVNEKGLQQYEAANPAWMSVAGLLRYWKKKLE